MRRASYLDYLDDVSLSTVRMLCLRFASTAGSHLMLASSYRGP